MGFLSGLVVCLSVLTVTVNCDTFAECEGVPGQTFVGSLRGCEFYIYCDNAESFEESCPNHVRFNSEDGSCDDGNIDCNTLDNSITPPQSTILVTTTTQIYTSLPEVTPSTTTDAPPSTTVSATSTLVTNSDGGVVCPQPSSPAEITYFPSPTSCSEYFMCYRLVAMPMTCPDNQHYNSLSQACDSPATANCRVVGTTTESPRELCTLQPYGVFAYPGNCHYYYRCTNGFLSVQECPVNFGWDVNKKMCSSSACKN